MVNYGGALRCDQEGRASADVEGIEAEGRGLYIQENQEGNASGSTRRGFALV